MHTYGCTHAHVWMHTCTRMDAHMHTYGCTHAHLWMHTCTRMDAHMHTQAHIHVHAHPDTHACMLTHEHMHTYMHTCTHAHTMHICMHNSTFVCMHACTHTHVHTHSHTHGHACTCTQVHAHMQAWVCAHAFPNFLIVVSYKIHLFLKFVFQVLCNYHLPVNSRLFTSSIKTSLISLNDIILGGFLIIQ